MDKENVMNSQLKKLAGETVGGTSKTTKEPIR